MKVRVLIADDEKHGRECLRKQHVDIIAERSDGLKTLETLKHHGVDLAFLAVCLPQLDASEVLKELEGGIGTAVVFVCDNDRFAAKAFDTGCGGLPGETIRSGTLSARIQLCSTRCPAAKGQRERRGHKRIP